MTLTPSGRHAAPLTPLSPKVIALLNAVQDQLPDYAQARSLGEALQRRDPLDVLRMLAQQWSRGLSTLAGDHEVKHPEHVPVTTSHQFVAALRAHLQAEHELSGQLGQGLSAEQLSEEIRRHLRSNQVLSAAWCTALLWRAQQQLN